MARLIPSIATRLADPDAERSRRNHDDRISEIQKQPGLGLRVIPLVQLPDGTATTVHHGLDHAPLWISPSAVRGPSSSGRIEEIRDGSHDRKTVVVLKATGFGATITIDLAVL